MDRLDDNHFYESALSNIPGGRDVQRIPPAPPGNPPKSAGNSAKENQAEESWKKQFLLSLVVVITMLVILVVLAVWNKIDISQVKDGGCGNKVVGGSPSSLPSTDNSNSGGDTPTSCLELKRRGHTKDGTYVIQPSREFFQEVVFCDMSTDGGGWTLVASVHDNDIKRKCDPDDMWSYYLTSSNKKYIAGENWQNEMTFGDVNHATKRDYKNAAYSKLNASDVMIWHAQVSLPINLMATVTKFRYRSSNHFLRKYGGNLYSLYKNHFPLIPAQTTNRIQETVQKILSVLEEDKSDLKGYISNWYEYTWSRGSDRITNADLFSSFGNDVHMYSTRCSHGVTYGYFGSCYYSDLYWISSGETQTISPFFTISVIYNDQQKDGDFRLRVYSYRQTGNETKADGALYKGSYKLQYHVRQTSHASYPALCEFHFMASNVQKWGSKEPTSYSQSYEHADPKFGHIFQASGTPRNIVMGYILLTRSVGKLVTEEQIQNVANYVLNKISTIPSLFPDYLQESSSVRVPVTFDQGSSKDLLAAIPPKFKTLVQPGFVQFRAYNFAGYPNAFCPGVKAKTFFPEYVCIGGISDSVGTKGTCGDFAGWEGTSDDSVSGSTAVGSAHSLADIYSTILIFYR